MVYEEMCKGIRLCLPGGDVGAISMNDRAGRASVLDAVAMRTGAVARPGAEGLRPGWPGSQALNMLASRPSSRSVPSGQCRKPPFITKLERKTAAISTTAAAKASASATAAVTVEMRTGDRGGSSKIRCRRRWVQA